MDKHTLNSLNPARFVELNKNRETAIASAPGDLPTADYPANRLAEKLHPKRQFLKVCGIAEQADCKTYVLKPDEELGTTECAYFSAGQYVSVFVNIGGKVLSRPYSISSSPKEALQGCYLLTVKAVTGGLVSNHILDKWTIGTSVEVSDPMGTFTYEPLRDAKHIIGIAGGSGITPFISLAKAIADGDEDCALTLLYGSRTEKDVLFQDELKKLADKCKKINVVHVLSEEQKDEYEFGFITSDLIKKYAPDAPYSVFLCGPEQMIRFVDKEIDKLNLERKYIRHEVHGEVCDPTTLPEYPANVTETVSITVICRGEKSMITGNSKNTVLRILEQNGITPPSRCRSGECGFCHSRLISGRVFIPDEFDKRRQADEKYGYIHPCCSYPLSDLEIEVSKG